MLICGVDEAGRGPVIGPLVIAVVVMEESDERKMKDLGVTDSKLLDSATRSKLFKNIEELSTEIKIKKLSAEQVDKWMSTASLNDVEVIETAELLNSLNSNPSKAYIDSPDTNEERYAQNIKNLCKKKLKIVAEHKADLKYTVCSAASIIAKVTRDREIEKFKKQYGKIGSGYPSDEITKKWIDDYWEVNKSFPNIVRKKWMTIQNKMQGRLTEW